MACGKSGEYSTIGVSQTDGKQIQEVYETLMNYGWNQYSVGLGVEPELGELTRREAALGRRERAARGAGGRAGGRVRSHIGQRRGPWAAQRAQPACLAASCRQRVLRAPPPLQSLFWRWFSFRVNLGARILFLKHHFDLVAPRPKPLQGRPEVQRRRRSPSVASSPTAPDAWPRQMHSIGIWHCWSDCC